MGNFQVTQKWTGRRVEGAIGVVKETIGPIEVWKAAFVDAFLYQLRKRMHYCAFPFTVNRFFCVFYVNLLKG